MRTSRITLGRTRRLESERAPSGLAACARLGVGVLATAALGSTTIAVAHRCACQRPRYTNPAKCGAGFARGSASRNRPLEQGVQDPEKHHGVRLCGGLIECHPDTGITTSAGSCAERCSNQQDRRAASEFERSGVFPPCGIRAVERDAFSNGRSPLEEGGDGIRWFTSSMPAAARSRYVTCAG
jgi:hypothetical protein